MFTLLAITAVGVATLAGAYWYLHKVNPDVAQDVTDELVKDIKEQVDTLKDKIND